MKLTQAIGVALIFVGIWMIMAYFYRRKIEQLQKEIDEAVKAAKLYEKEKDEAAKLHEKDKEEAAKLYEKEKNKAMLHDIVTKIILFTSLHKSNSSSCDRHVASREFSDMIPGDYFFDSSDFPAISKSEWQKLKKKITKIVFHRNAEVIGVHPRVNEILAFCCKKSGEKYQVAHELGLADLIADVSQRPRPDFSILEATCASTHIDLNQAVLLIEVKKEKNSTLKAIRQAMGYLSMRLAYQIEMSRSFDKELWGFCIGTDGDDICVGKLHYVNKEMIMYISPDYCLWPASRNSSAPLGIRLLLYLLSMSPAELGVVSGVELKVSPVLPPMRVINALGVGSFCCVLSVQSDDGLDPQMLKAPKLMRKTHRDEVDELNMLNSEINALLVLNANPVKHASIPRILFPDRPYLELSLSSWILCDQVGIPLCTYAVEISFETKQAHAAKLYSDLKSAVKYAHSKNICHCDIRPANIIVTTAANSSSQYILIDWGLARATGQVIHDHLGGIVFFHDDIVNLRYKKKSETPVLPYKPDYDIQAVAYNALAFALSKSPHLEPPWIKRDANLNMIQTRQKYFTEHAELFK